MGTETAELIVDVFTYHGKPRDADDRLRPHLVEIGERYNELKRVPLDFMSAYRKACVEWVEKQLNAAEKGGAA